MADKPYEERGGGAYVRLKDGRTVPEDSWEGQIALGKVSAENTAEALDGEASKPATAKKVK